MTEKKPFSIIPSVTNRVGKFTLSGYITPDKNSGAQITDAFDLLIADKACDVINLTLMNLYGGSVNEGIPSMNAIQNCPKPIVINTEGLIASMGISLLASAKGIHKVIGGKMSRYLIHKCGTSAEGNSDDLREAADMADGLEADMVQALSDKTGMTTDEIKTLWMKRGVDTILTAKEALDCGLIDEITDGIIKKDLPKNVIRNSDIKAIMGFYDKQLELINSTLTPPYNNMEKLPKMAAKLNLAENSTEEVVMIAIDKLTEDNAALVLKNTEMKASFEKVHDELIDTVVDGAVDAGKITLAEKETYRKLASKDLDSVKALFGGKKAHVTASSKINNDDKDQKDPYEGYSFKDYQKKAPGALAKMQTEAPEKFKALKDEYIASR